ncbi:alpha/beta hydrolase [Streptomyces werraensis]|nr:alpha/beta hydrolase [Streptomyces werraensis]
MTTRTFPASGPGTRPRAPATRWCCCTAGSAPTTPGARSGPSSPPPTASTSPSGGRTATPRTSRARCRTPTWPGDTVAFLESVVGGPAHLVGWSDGGVVALLTALARPDLVRRMVLIGATFRPAPEAFVAPEMLDALTPDSAEMAFFRELYVAVSPDGPDHWPAVATRVIDMWRTQPMLDAGDLAAVRAPTLVMAGDDDLMTLEHTAALYRALHDARLAVVPGASHLVPLEKPAEVDRMILDHLAGTEAGTMMPVLRAPAPAPGRDATA